MSDKCQRQAAQITLNTGLTMCRVIRQVYQCVRGRRLAVRKAWCCNGSDHLKTFIVLHLNHNVLKDLVVQSVAAVKLSIHTSHHQQLAKQVSQSSMLIKYPITRRSALAASARTSHQAVWTHRLPVPATRDVNQTFFQDQDHTSN